MNKNLGKTDHMHAECGMTYFFFLTGMRESECTTWVANGHYSTETGDNTDTITQILTLGS